MNVLAITSPIFIVIGLGYLAVRLDFFPKDRLSAIGIFVIHVTLPGLLFKSLSQRDFSEVLNLRYIVAFSLGSLATLGLGMAWARYVRKEGVTASAITGMGMACANSAFVGYPIALQVVGPPATIALALTMIVENVLMIPLCIALADSGMARHESLHVALGRALLGLRKQPIIIAIVAGFLFSMFRIELPGPVHTTVDMIAAASAPVSLFFIGGNLVGLELHGMLRKVGLVTLGKLVLHPMMVCAAVLLIGHIDPLLGASAVLISCATMLSIYPIIGQKHGMEGFCAATLLVATVASFFTMSGVLWWLHSHQVFSLFSHGLVSSL